MTSVPMLTISAGLEGFTMYIDDLGTDLGAVLMQQGKVVAYASR